MARNPDQMKRLGSVIYEAIITESMAENGEVILDTALIFDVLMSVGGTLIAGDPQFATPQGVRLFAEKYAKELQYLIKSERNNPDRANAFPSEISGKRQ